jgi:hypothetical protein
MKPESAQTPSFNAADEDAIRAIHQKMIGLECWRCHGLYRSLYP